MSIIVEIMNIIVYKQTKMLPYGYTVRRHACPEAHIFVLLNMQSTNLAHIPDWCANAIANLAHISKDNEYNISDLR